MGSERNSPPTKNLSGKRIKLARVARDMKQVDLRVALSEDYKIVISQAAMSDIERGKRFIADIELDAFAKVLDVNPLWLMYGERLPKFSETLLRGK